MAAVTLRADPNLESESVGEPYSFRNGLSLSSSNRSAIATLSDASPGSRCLRMGTRM